MLENFLFVGLHYAAIAIFSLSCWGWGNIFLIKSRRDIKIDPWLRNTLAITIGMVFFICTFQIVAIAGFLNKYAIYIIVAAGLAACIIRKNLAEKIEYENVTKDKYPSWQAAVVIIGLVGWTSVPPLLPPYMWDELSYHLPHAQEWASSGSLTVNKWLRYPWFPFNYQLLYASALVVYDDVFTHFLHSLAGWLTTILIYQFGKKYFSKAVGCLGGVIWIWLCRSEFGDAYVDMGVTLFIFSSYISFQLWIENNKDQKWINYSALFLGAALGSKYQALTFLPLFFIPLLYIEKRPLKIINVIILMSIPCVYWYARNYWMTGDPVSPIGGKIFGFTDWNLADYEYQISDIAKVYDWPKKILWPAILIVLINYFRKNSQINKIIIFCTYSLLIWMFTSHYSRYLMPAFPLMCIAASYVYIEFFNVIFKTFLQGKLWFYKYIIFGKSILILVLVGGAAYSMNREWVNVAFNEEQRIEKLKVNFHMRKYIDIVSYLNDNKLTKIYQHGMEGALYYAPRHTWGDHFGPGRYRDFVTLPPDKLSEKLQGMGLDFLVLPAPQNNVLVLDSDFGKYFQTLNISPTFGVYRIIKAIP